MMLWPVGPSLLSTTHVWCAACCVSWVGVEPGGVVVGVGVDTLLSPEASAVRQVSLALQDWSSRWWRSAWVGVFLVNWIVDASIFATTCRHPGVLLCCLLGGGGGGWGGRCCDVLTTASASVPVSPWELVL